MAIPASIPTDEKERLDALHGYRILDTVPDPEFDDLATLAAEICGTPIALVSLVDSHRQWFKARVGLDAEETPRELAFCAHAILQDGVFVVPNALEDERFADNALVTEDPNIRFYAGAPLVNPEGHSLGTLCVIDNEPRELDASQLRALAVLGRQVISQMELRSKLRQLGDVMDDMAQTQAALAESNAELENFASIVSHDLKEPLRKILVFGDRLRSRSQAGLDERNLDYLGRMQKASTRMQVLIHGLLEYSRVQTRPEPFQVVDLGEIVNGVLVDLEIAVEESHAKVHVGELPRIDAAPLQMRQLFQNLIANAIKFRAPETAPTIHIDARPDDDSLRIEVRDEGIGFEPEYAERIFGIFQRLHGRSEYPGTGIGLAICRRIAERHGGTLRAIGEPGVGATFVIEVPASRILPVAQPPVLEPVGSA